MIRTAAIVATLALLAGSAEATTPGPFASAAEQQSAMASGAATSEALVKAALARIAAIDRAGPRLNAVIALNPHALADARTLDAERRAGHIRGPLHGVPILLKDNIESDDGTAATAGSLALAANVTGRDAPLVRRLTDAGAVILGKANLSEWANFRGARSVSGWSAVGGMVRNPHILDRGPCGSSAGSAVAVAAGLVPVAIGTETDGSVTCPAALNGVVGLKPTVGLVSRTYIVPISPEQDTAGPIARTVTDAAALLTVIAGSDPTDPATAQADSRKTNYAAALDAQALKGARIGVMRTNAGRSPQADVVFETALAALANAGAVLVEVKSPDAAIRDAIGTAEGAALRAEFKPAINAYLAGLPAAVKARTLNDLIAFNAAEPRETALFGQEIFQQAAAAPPLTDAAYIAPRTSARTQAREALDAMLKEASADVLVGVSGGPASVVDPINGTQGTGSYSTLPAVAGYPHLTVPAGFVSGLPVGLSFIGPAWSEARLLTLGYAFEQATHARRDPQFLPSLAAAPNIAKAFNPR